ncbi:MAG: response regulator transcription factor [Vallitaleaceae bacterium]|nr:response regulator transcription factor [Vallitaleaceae bacterium]
MYNINILIAEDEDRLRQLIVKYFKQEGYQVFEAANGMDALAIFNDESIDLVVLDVMMPVLDGYGVCRTIRKTSNLPVIMLTARGEEDDKLLGFDLGVDDYMTKPFSTRELVARVKALLKRSGKTEVDDIVTYGDITIRPLSRQVKLGDIEVNLSPKEYDLLMFFSDNKNRALSREQILNRVWGYDFYGDDRTVDTIVKRLRKKLEHEGERIHTVRSVGYRFEVK